jgi:hypothetical protein
MTKLFRTLLTGSGLLAWTLAHADVVADWNAIALNAVESSAAHPAAAQRALAGIHVAMFEAMNFIERRYVPRLVVRPASPIAASSEAAAAVAAHLVLSRLYPGRSAAFDAALERSLAEIPDDGRKTSGTVTGRAIGGNVYAVWTWEEPAARAPGVPEAASDPLLWNLIAAKLIEGRALAPIEAARVHALVAIAVSDIYSAAGRGSRAWRTARPCVSCAAGVATLRVLESVRVRDSGTTLRKLDDGTILRALLTYSERSAEPSDRRVGEGFGAHALSHYRPVI